MNAKTLIAAAALAVIGSSAIADEVRDYPTPSTLTRAEVQAEVARAQAEKSLGADAAYGDVRTVVAQRKDDGRAVAVSREQVKQQVQQALANGTLVVAGEAYGTVEPGLNLRSRAEVRAEAIAAMRNRFGEQGE